MNKGVFYKKNFRSLPENSISIAQAINSGIVLNYKNGYLHKTSRLTPTENFSDVIELSVSQE